jgi:hypothetical protein
MRFGKRRLSKNFVEFALSQGIWLQRFLARLRFMGLKRVYFSNSNFGFVWWQSAMTFGFRISNFVILLLLLSSLSLFAQSKPSPMLPTPPIDRAEGEKQARALVSALLAQRPTQNYTNTQVVRIHPKKKPQQEIPVLFLIIPTPTNFSNIYELTGSSAAGTTLSIVHTPNQPNEYFLRLPVAPGAPTSVARRLTPAELNLPFAGSDFSIGDLGLEFLHWPQQRILRKEIRMKLSCVVLQSTNPNPIPGAYSRVETWIDANQPDKTVIVRADAYDLNNKLLKQFEPKKVEKINGAYQLEEMEMRNVQTGSRTRIEFNLDKD